MRCQLSWKLCCFEQKNFKKAKYGLNPVPDLDQEPESEPEPKLSCSRNQNRISKKSLRFTSLLKRKLELQC
jgi:hypothetical protein